jgi:hypothetical protein
MGFFAFPDFINQVHNTCHIRASFCAASASLKQHLHPRDHSIPHK